MRASRYNVVVERGDRVWVYNGLSGCTTRSCRPVGDVERFLAGDD